MKILSIETSCDETGVTIMEASGKSQPMFKILGNSLASQIKIHKEYGGVYPMLAKREHIKNLPILLNKVSRQAKLTKSVKPVDLIAVTAGPGLEPALWTGIVFAQELAQKWKVPVVPVNHMEGHILSPFGKDKGKFTIPKIKTPALSLLVSGGHTELVLARKWLHHEIIGETLDDAVGEAFDKVARMLGLPYPGGPEISKLAEKARKKSLTDTFTQSLGPSLRSATHSQKHTVADFSFSLPRPMLHSKNFDFSFSGLKTAVLYLIRDIGPLDKNTKSRIALEFENAAIETLVHKTKKSVEKYGIKTLIVAGGVAANKHLNREVKKSVGKKVKILFPGKGLSGDNSIMIGMAGYIKYMRDKRKLPRPSSIKATGNLRL